MLLGPKDGDWAQTTGDGSRAPVPPGWACVDPPLQLRKYTPPPNSV